MRKYFCGTPKEKCTGGSTAVSHGVGVSHKTHASSEDAFRCYASWLISEGYIQLGAKEFKIPDGKPGAGSVLVLDKKSKFGGVLRFGKEKTRWMPKPPVRKGNSGGSIF